MDNYGTALNEFWDKQALKLGESNMLFGKPIGYKSVKIPKYFKIKIPKIEWNHYHSDDYGSMYEGILIYFESVELFKIGYTIVKKPIYKKSKGSTIKFNRYGNVSSITCTHLDGSGFEIGEIKEDEE